MRQISITIIHFCETFVNNGSIRKVKFNKYKLKSGNKMSSTEIIRVFLAKRYMTITQLATLLSAQTGRNYTRQSLSKKLSRNSLKFSEVEIIGQILNFKIDIVDLRDEK